MSLYDTSGKAAKIIKFADENKIALYSPISVKIELSKVLQREMKFTPEEIVAIFEGLPVKWMEKEIYEWALEKTKVKHKADKPIEALASILNCGILTAGKHFDNVKNKLDVNDVLEKLEL